MVRWLLAALLLLGTNAFDGDGCLCSNPGDCTSVRSVDLRDETVGHDGEFFATVPELQV